MITEFGRLFYISESSNTIYQLPIEDVGSFQVFRSKVYAITGRSFQ